MKRSESVAEQPKPANDTDTTTPDAEMFGAFGEHLARAIAQGIAATSPPRQVTFTEYIDRPGNPHHPDREKALTRTYRVNGGSPLNRSVSVLDDKELGLLEMVTPGRYCDGKVIVTEKTI